jgi:hypothetical protein
VNNQLEMLLDMLQLYAEHNFEGMTPGDELWFLYTTYGDSRFATSAREIVSRTKQNISAKKIMVTIFFTSIQLLVLNALPKGTKFNQDNFIDTVLPKETNCEAQGSAEFFSPHGQFSASYPRKDH